MLQTCGESGPAFFPTTWRKHGWHRDLDHWLCPAMQPWTAGQKGGVDTSAARMRVLHKFSEFSAPTEDMVTIYVSYVRSILEQSCTVWHSSLTIEDSEDLERVQKSAMKIILKEEYLSYEQALEKLMLCKLSERREKMCLKFAKNCTKNDLTSDLFPLNIRFLKSERVISWAETFKFGGLGTRSMVEGRQNENRSSP